MPPYDYPETNAAAACYLCNALPVTARLFLTGRARTTTPPNLLPISKCTFHPPIHQRSTPNQFADAYSRLSLSLFLTEHRSPNSQLVQLRHSKHLTRQSPGSCQIHRPPVPALTPEFRTRVSIVTRKYLRFLF